MFYEEVLTKLQDFQVRFVVVGAVAVNLHGIPRMTADLDLFADLAEGNLSAFIRALEDLGYKPRLPVPARALLDPESRPQWVEVPARLHRAAAPVAGSGKPVFALRDASRCQGGLAEIPPG